MRFQIEDSYSSNYRFSKSFLVPIFLIIDGGQIHVIFYTFATVVSLGDVLTSKGASKMEESSGHALMNIRAVESARTMEYYDRAEWRRAKYIRIRGRLWLRERQRYLSVRMQRAAFRHGLIYLSWLARFLTLARIQGGAVKNHYLNTVETYNIRGSRAYIIRGEYIIQTSRI